MKFKNPAEKAEKLTKFYGFGMPTASAILHFLDEKIPIIDKNAYRFYLEYTKQKINKNNNPFSEQDFEKFVNWYTNFYKEKNFKNHKEANFYIMAAGKCYRNQKKSEKAIEKQKDNYINNYSKHYELCKNYARKKKFEELILAVKLYKSNSGTMKPEKNDIDSGWSIFFKEIKKIL